MSESVNDRAESIRQRLRNRLRERGEDVQFGLQRYAVERFLYRLGASLHRNSFVLKGAALFALWGGPIYRPTRDLDFTTYGSAEEVDVVSALRDICRHSYTADEIVFNPDTLSAEPIRDDSEYFGMRIRIGATLGMSRIPLQIDIGFGNAIEPPPQEAEYPTLLGDPPPRIRTYPPEAVIAEKLHAMVVLGDRNSRYKDFYDLHVFARQFTFEGIKLARSIGVTFNRRRTAIDPTVPVALTPRFYADVTRATQWRAYLTRNTLPGAPADFVAVGELLQTFLGPVWSALTAKRAFADAWPAGGPWSSGAPSDEIASGQLASERTNLSQDSDLAAPFRRLKAHATYKDSGVEWLGQIPEHWEMKRLKYVAALNPAASEVRRLAPDTEVSFVPMEAVGEYGGLDLSRTKPLADVGTGYTYFRDGDVVVAKITPCFENGKGAHAEGLVNRIAFGTTELHVLRASQALDGHFLFYLTLSDAFRRLGEAEMYGAGGQKRVPESFVENLWHPLPSVSEQRAIAAFLDGETAKIDAMVAKKERLIALLQEKRAALITRAVTKGLDLNVPMKYSGVEWLGEIPAHWNVKRLKFLTHETLQYGANEASGDTDPDQPRFVRITDITTSGELREDTFRSLPLETAKDYLLEEGDLLLARSGATVGKSFMYKKSWGVCCYAGYLIRVRPDQSQILPEFLNYFAASQNYWDWISASLIQATIENVSAEKYANLLVGVASLPEQKAVVEYLDKETSKIDALITEVREGIEKLKEYRTALISAAVTGKIDVRA